MADDHAPADGEDGSDAGDRGSASGGRAGLEEDGAAPAEERERAAESEDAPADVATAGEADAEGAQVGDIEDETADVETAPAGEADDPSSTDASAAHATDDEDVPPADVRKYERFKKMDGAQYDRVNEFLRDRTYITAREWAIARLCADFRTETGVEMTKIGRNLPELVPFMTDTYTPQAVNQARSAFEDKVRMAGATFLYGAMSGFFTAEELDEMMYEVTEVAKFLLEVEGVDLAVAEELDAEERISSVMREVREASADLRQEELDADDD